MMKRNSVLDVRDQFVRELIDGRVVKGKTPELDTIEILDASFTADYPTIFGEIDADYQRREIDWYLSQSLNVEDMEGPIPSIWQDVSDVDGFINSNYGWLALNKHNGEQYNNALKALRDNPNTRQAVMIYQRPSMHYDHNRRGMRDFICTYAAQVSLRQERVDETDEILDVLHYSVFMRSNDAVYGYKNDLAWHEYVQELILFDLLDLYPDIDYAPIEWHAGSLHVYRRHFDLVHNYKGS